MKAAQHRPREDSLQKNRWIVATLMTGIVWISGGRAVAQDAGSQAAFDQDIKLFRKDVRSLKKQIIAANMDLSDTEAEQFWPIYDRYTAELTAIYDTKFALLEEYAENYAAMTSPQAERYLNGRAEAEESITQLRLKYIPIFRKVLSGKSTALFFQLDWRLGLVIELQLASQTPLIEP
jgi:hypothetical protein